MTKLREALSGVIMRRLGQNWMPPGTDFLYDLERAVTPLLEHSAAGLTMRDADDVIEGLVRSMVLWGGWEDGIPADVDVQRYWRDACDWLGLDSEHVSIATLNEWRARRADKGTP